ncbi:MAG: molybdopterin-synthase adenylyltransferase MoeB [Dehalococcoidia bacterium]|nr:molybdopterin-synthase adenylyltransferase MoeB [Dehalococcoidia bacterium]
MLFSEEQMRRYQAHIVLPNIGTRGQRKLMQAKVLIVGAGGLGSSSAFYLTAAGIGRLGLVDPDRVEVSNLQRQILHRTRDIGRLKVESAAETLRALNPDVEIITYPTRLTAANAREIIGDYDVVVDGTDNFPARYLLNDTCYFLRKPYVYGSVWRFEGQTTVFIHGNGCYRCLFPSPPSGPAAPSCQDAGVFGVLPGIIGTIEATEALKLVIGAGLTLTNRLLLFNGLDMEFRTVKWHRAPNCPLCGASPTITDIADYGLTCYPTSQ